MGPVTGTTAEGWRTALGKLGAPSPVVGARIQPHPGKPPIAGVVEQIGPEAHPNQMIVRLEQPSLGAAMLSTCGFGEQTFFVGSFYFFGPQATEGLKAEKEWQEWLDKSGA